MSKVSEDQRVFRELLPPMGEHVRTLLGDAKADLVISPRDDGALWFSLGEKQVRVILIHEPLGQILLSVHEGGNDQAVRDIPAVLSADPKILAESIALELKR